MIIDQRSILDFFNNLSAQIILISSSIILGKAFIAEPGFISGLCTIILALSYFILMVCNFGVLFDGVRKKDYWLNKEVFIPADNSKMNRLVYALKSKKFAFVIVLFLLMLVSASVIITSVIAVQALNSINLNHN